MDTLKYKVLKEFNLGGMDLTVDSVVSNDVLTDEAEKERLLEEGFLELEDDNGDEDKDIGSEENGEDKNENTENGSDSSVSDTTFSDNKLNPTSPKTLDGKEIISDVSREVNEKTYHHVKLLDGSTQDLTDEEYKAKVS